MNNQLAKVLGRSASWAIPVVAYSYDVPHLPEADAMARLWLKDDKRSGSKYFNNIQH